MSHKIPVNNNGRKVVVVQSKISPATAKRLDVIVKKFGFSARYEILQYLISAFLHYADPEGESRQENSDEMSQIAKIFEGSESRKKRLASRIDESGKSITDVVQILKSKGSNAYSCRWTHLSPDGDTDTAAVPAVFQLIMSRLMPDRYDYLMKVASELGSTSALRALDYLIEVDRRCGTSEAGDYASNTYGIVPVRKHHKTIK